MNLTQILKWQREIVRYFLLDVLPDRGRLVFIATLMLVMTAANALLIWKIGGVITQITLGKFDELNTSLLLIAMLVLFNQLIQIVQAYTLQRVTLRFIDRVRGKLLGHILQLSFSINNQFAKGDLLTRLSSDVDKLLPFMINAPLNLFSNLVVLTVYSSILFWVDWQLALIIVAMAPIFYFTQYYVAPKAGRASRHFIQENANLVVVEEQTLSNLRGISSFNSEQMIRNKHKIQFDTARRWALKARKISILYNAFFTSLIYFAGVIVIYSGIASIQSGQMAVGVLVSFLIYVRLLSMPVRTIAGIPIRLQANRAGAERVMAVMNMLPTVKEDENKTQLQVKQGTIVFDDVSFAYPGSTDFIFKNLSINILAGESVALVGPSGAGKSTLASLLLRFFDPQQGRIEIDGIDIKRVSLASLRKQISLVWQEPFLINGSIRENLLLAKPDATQAQMKQACQSGFSWEFIEKLPQGMNTVIGTSGTRLSVGQKQRLAVSQAFLRDTPVLILDEATSALDSHSEKMLVEALSTLRKARTTLIIAHRFSSIRTADRVLYFDSSGNVTSGTHDELMSSIDEYHEAVKWQTTTD